MGQKKIQASPLIVVLLSVHFSILVSSRPAFLLEPQPICNVDKFSAYFLQMYSLYSEQAQLKAVNCTAEFNDQPINPAFCLCDSISGKSAEPQRGPETATGVVEPANGIGSGESRDQPDNLFTALQSCGFTVSLDLTSRSNDEPIAADLAIYKLPSSYSLSRKINYTVSLTVMEHSQPIITTTKTIEHETAKGWQVFRADDLVSALTFTNHEFYIEVEIEEDGDLLSCSDIQTLFILDCSTLVYHSDNIPSDENLMPILTFFTQSKVPWWQLYWGRKKRDTMDRASSLQLTEENQPFFKCQKAPLVMSTQQVLGEEYEVLFPETVDIGNCIELSGKIGGGSNAQCSPAEWKSVYTFAKNKRTGELVQKMLPVISACA